MSGAKNCRECNLKEKAGENVYYCPKLRAVFYADLLSQKLCEEADEK
jgi:hypothetical protein